jgi:hypothetical protein
MRGRGGQNFRKSRVSQILDIGCHKHSPAQCSLLTWLVIQAWCWLLQTPRHPELSRYIHATRRSLSCLATCMQHPGHQAVHSAVLPTPIIWGVQVMARQHDTPPAFVAAPHPWHTLRCALQQTPLHSSHHMHAKTCACHATDCISAYAQMWHLRRAKYMGTCAG